MQRVIYDGDSFISLKTMAALLVRYFVVKYGPPSMAIAFSRISTCSGVHVQRLLLRGSSPEKNMIYGYAIGHYFSIIIGTLPCQSTKSSTISKHSLKTARNERAVVGVRLPKKFFLSSFRRRTLDW